MSKVQLNSVPNKKVLDWKHLQLSKVSKPSLKIVSDRIENTVRKGENDVYQNFHLFKQCLQLIYFFYILCVCVWGGVICCPVKINASVLFFFCSFLKAILKMMLLLVVTTRFYLFHYVNCTVKKAGFLSFKRVNCFHNFRPIKTILRVNGR